MNRLYDNLSDEIAAKREHLAQLRAARPEPIDRRIVERRKDVTEFLQEADRRQNGRRFSDHPRSIWSDLT